MSTEEKKDLVFNFQKQRDGKYICTEKETNLGYQKDLFHEFLVNTKDKSAEYCEKNHVGEIKTKKIYKNALPSWFTVPPGADKFKFSFCQKVEPCSERAFVHVASFKEGETHNVLYALREHVKEIQEMLQKKKTTKRIDILFPEGKRSPLLCLTYTSKVINVEKYEENIRDTIYTHTASETLLMNGTWLDIKKLISLGTIPYEADALIIITGNGKTEPPMGFRNVLHRKQNNESWTTKYDTDHCNWFRKKIYRDSCPTHTLYESYTGDSLILRKKEKIIDGWFENENNPTMIGCLFEAEKCKSLFSAYFSQNKEYEIVNSRDPETIIFLWELTSDVTAQNVSRSIIPAELKDYVTNLVGEISPKDTYFCVRAFGGARGTFVSDTVFNDIYAGKKTEQQFVNLNKENVHIPSKIYSKTYTYSSVQDKKKCIHITFEMKYDDGPFVYNLMSCIPKIISPSEEVHGLDSLIEGLELKVSKSAYASFAWKITLNSKNRFCVVYKLKSEKFCVRCGNKKK